MKKLISMILALAMVFALCACGAQPAPAPAPAASQAPAESQAPVEETPAEPAHLTIGIPQNSKVEDYKTCALTKWIEENTNTDLEFVFFTGSTEEKLQQLALMVSAGEKLPDIMLGFMDWRDPTNCNQYGEDGYFLNYASYYEEGKLPIFKQAVEDIQDETLRQRLITTLTDPADNAMYGFPWACNMVVWDDCQYTMNINTKWLEACNLEMPTTIAELEKVLEAFSTTDCNGNGENDEIAFLGQGKDNYDQTLYILEPYVYFDSNYNLNVTDGKIWTAFTTDEYREGVKEIAKLTQAGYLDAANFTNIATAELKSLNQPETTAARIGMTGAHPESVMGADSLVYDQYDVTLPLKAETDKGGILVQRPQDIRVTSAITTDCEDVEAALRFMDFLYSDAMTASFRHGIQGSDWEFAADPETVTYADGNIIIMGDGQSFWDGARTWCTNCVGVLEGRNYLVVPDETNQTSAMEKKLETYMASAKKQEVVVGLQFTAEELEVVNSIKTLLAEYIRQARSEFATGVKDINSDADWAEYLDNLNKLGLEEYVAVNQAAYDRSHK